MLKKIPDIEKYIKYTNDTFEGKAKELILNQMNYFIKTK